MSIVSGFKKKSIQFINLGLICIRSPFPHLADDPPYVLHFICIAAVWFANF